ncbi:hypothetical protein PIB30_080285 [Stylosanthes scabra]|uniref:NB-ARC domain-containing protein n=1 Tax=Stylosanthes scabra TaxID=79078 RepID=A0ABU6ZQP6_9FABA|nr:hypothetical protein [Stylosanthes scabra]
MIRKVRESLSGKKYLVVLDDVWQTYVWDAIKEKSRRQRSAMKHQFDLHPAAAGDYRTKIITDVLKLNYDGLPQRLKPCFLYFGIFPKDYEISAKELILLWIAEGYISREDVAEEYLCELVDPSLVQVVSKRRDGGIKTCRIHDLLHGLCISEGGAIMY